MTTIPLAAANTNTWSSVWYPELNYSLRRLAGRGPDDSTTGEPLPNLSAIATVAVVGLVTPAVVAAINRFNKQYNDRPEEMAAALSVNVSEDGELRDRYSKFIDAKTYLQYNSLLQDMGSVNDRPWQRYPSLSGNVGKDITDLATGVIGSYEIYYIATGTVANIWSENHATTERRNVFHFLRQMIVDYQRMVIASSSAIYANSADATGPAPSDDLMELFGALRSLCSDLDVLHENPPTLVGISEAAKLAVSKVAEFTGKALGEVSEEVGKYAGIIGGSVAEGFLANAGILSVVVVAIVFHLFIK